MSSRTDKDNMVVTNKSSMGFVLKGYPRISETFISNEIHLLEKLGFSLHLFSMRHPRESYTHESVKLIQAPVDYLPETLLRHLSRLVYHNAHLAKLHPSRYSDGFKLMLRRWQRSRKIATLKHLFQAGYLVHKLIPGSGVRHLHAHFAHSPTSVALFASQLSGLPFSFTGHAKDIYTSNSRQLREKILLAKFVVTCTEYNREYLQSLISGETTIHCVYHGIDVGLFSPSAERRKPSPPYRVLTVARLVEKKGLPTVFRALRCLIDRGCSVRYTLIGDGEERDSLLALIRALGLGHVCDWLGTQPHQVVLDHYSKADLFVLGCEVAPNGDRDGIPNVFLESMAMGVPVLSTRVSAIPELVQDGSSGLLVPPGEPEIMAETMERLLVDNNLRRQLTAAAQQRILTDFDNRKLIKRLGELFEDAGVERTAS
jgi:glycosyltransferase involved in cell wall biosynthesis